MKKSKFHLKILEEYFLHIILIDLFFLVILKNCCNINIKILVNLFLKVRYFSYLLKFLFLALQYILFDMEFIQEILVFLILLIFNFLKFDFLIMLLSSTFSYTANFKTEYLLDFLSFLNIKLIDSFAKTLWQI